MTTPKTKLAGLALIAALCAGFTLGLTAPAWAGYMAAGRPRSVFCPTPPRGLCLSAWRRLNWNSTAADSPRASARLPIADAITRSAWKL